MEYDNLQGLLYHCFPTLCNSSRGCIVPPPPCTFGSYSVISCHYFSMTMMMIVLLAIAAVAADVLLMMMSIVSSYPCAKSIKYCVDPSTKPALRIFHVGAQASRRSNSLHSLELARFLAHLKTQVWSCQALRAFSCLQCTLLVCMPIDASQSR